MLTKKTKKTNSKATSKKQGYDLNNIKTKKASHFSSSVLSVLSIDPFYEYCNLSETFYEILKNKNDKVTISLVFTWGYDINDEMTEPINIILTIPSSLTIVEGWIKLMFAYKENVPYPRDYIFEGYSIEENGVVSFNYGT